MAGHSFLRISGTLQTNWNCIPMLPVQQVLEQFSAVNGAMGNDRIIGCTGTLLYLSFILSSLAYICGVIKCKIVVSFFEQITRHLFM